QLGLFYVGRQEADALDLAGPPRLAHGLRGARNGGRRDRHHELHRRIHAQDRLRLGERLVAVVVARPDRREHELRILLNEALADVRDPFVLVRRAERAGDDRELPLAAEQARGLVGEAVGDAFGRRLVDEEVARVGLGVGVPGEHLDPAFARLAQHRRNPAAVLDRDRNRVDPAGDPVLDQLVLTRRVEAGRAVPDELDAELPGGFFRARAAADGIPLALRP